VRETGSGNRSVIKIPSQNIGQLSLAWVNP